MQNNMIVNPAGQLFEESFLLEIFDENQLQCINKLRYYLIESFPNLREKVNKNSKYFGFGVDENHDVFYIYLQKKKMILDINIPNLSIDDLIESGLTVVERNNYQARSGWTTGIHIDYNCNTFDTIKKLATKAIKNS